MQEKFNLLKCNICGNIAEIVHTGYGKPVWCVKELEILENIEFEESNPLFAHVEKINDNERRIYFNHEMTKEHLIEFVEVISNDKQYLKRKYFKIGQTPELILKCDCKAGYFVRVYCNIHNVCMTKNIEEK